MKKACQKVTRSQDPILMKGQCCLVKLDRLVGVEVPKNVGVIKSELPNFLLLVFPHNLVLPIHEGGSLTTSFTTLWSS